MMQAVSGRRQALRGLAVAAGAIGAGAIGARAAVAEPSLVASGATSLAELQSRLQQAGRRRDFKHVPMILTDPSEWDSAALNEVLSYGGAAKQVWDNTAIASAWLNLMRNAMNAQIWSYRHPDFLCVSNTHGSAQLALYDRAMWDKYGLARLAGEKFPADTLLKEPVHADPADFQSPTGLYSPKGGDSIPVLQRRGAVFMACHNAVWEVSSHLHASGHNPDHLSVDGIAADLSNHLIQGVVLTPGAVGTLVELERAGFAYGK